MHKWTVSSQPAGIKLLAFLMVQFNGRYSAKHLKRFIENNRCTVNGRTERFASAFLGNADKVTLLLEEPRSPNSLRVNRSAILYEDSDIFIYNKPSGINCDEAGILKLLRSYDSNLQLMHRLDRETTGALILVKNDSTHLFFLDQFKKLQVKKTYRTIVDGVLRKSQGTISNLLAKKKTFAGQSIWGAVKTGGVQAITSWKLIKSAQETSLLRCYPKTGRTHQIRVHMAEMNHPILGDYQYGKHFNSSYRPSHYLLHAEKISFLHPKTRQLMSVEAKLSHDFSKAEQLLFGI